MASELSSIIKEGDHVIFKKENNLRLFQVRERRDVWLEKTKFTLDGIIGHAYGTKFEVKGRGMVKLEKGACKQDDDQAAKDTGPSKDNRNLFDLDSNQKLSRDEIEQLKKDGVTGDKLIEQLIENSTTFQEKTEYAQQKWVKKKKKKHLLEFTILKPTSRLLCELQWSKGPSKICNLRIDTLAQILTLGNVRANTNVAIVDSCLGLVTGAVMERLGGFGKVVSFYNGSAPMRASLDAYGFPKGVLDNLHNFPLNLVNSLKHVSSVQPKQEATEQNDSIIDPPPSTAMETDSITTSEVADRPVNSAQTGTITEDIESASGTKTEFVNQSEVPADSSIDADKLNSNDVDSAEKEEKLSVDNNSEAIDSIIDPPPSTAMETDSITTSEVADRPVNSAQTGTITEDSGSASGTKTEVVNQSEVPADSSIDANKLNGNDVDSAEKEEKLSVDNNSEAIDSRPEHGKAAKWAKKNKNKKKKLTWEERTVIKEAREKEVDEARQILMQKDIDCLIVACKFHPTPIVLALLEYVAPSRQIVIFSQFKEAIEDCYIHLRDHGGVINFKFTESWLRDYQVLPNRTHPVIQMSGTGGYLMTATTVVT